MDFSTVKRFIESSLDILEMSKSKHASFRIVRQENGHYRVSSLLNSDTSSGGRRQKSKSNIQRDAQRKKDFLSKKSALNPKSPEPTSHREPRRVGTENADNTSRTTKNSAAGAGVDHTSAGADHPELTGSDEDNPEQPDVHPNPKEPSSVVEAERRKVFPKTFSEIVSTPIHTPISTTAEESTVNDEIYTTPIKSSTQTDKCSWEKAEKCMWFDPPLEGRAPTRHAYKMCKFHYEIHKKLPFSSEHSCDLHENRLNIFELKESIP